jgi:hypothetical protein
VLLQRAGQRLKRSGANEETERSKGSVVGSQMYLTKSADKMLEKIREKATMILETGKSNLECVVLYGQDQERNIAACVLLHNMVLFL